MRRRVATILPSALLLLACGCDTIDRSRDPRAASDTTGGAGTLVLNLQTPGLLRPGTEDRVRVSVANRSKEPTGDVRLELVMPGWLEPLPPRPGEREVTIGASTEEGTRLTYRIAGASLGPGQTQSVDQRVRVAAEGPIVQGAAPASRVVRARLLTPGGQALAQVESVLAVEGVAWPDSASPAAADSAPERAANPGARDRLGPVRLGMSAAELRRQAARARDTTWSQEGNQERGLVVPLDRGGQALAVLSADTVLRIEVRDTITRTREALGVGSRLSQLRATYGEGCAAQGEGVVVVWFPKAPGISFALDARPPRTGPVSRDLDRLPGTARVTRWWLHGGTSRCG